MATIDQYLAEKRARLIRVTPDALDAELADGALVVDIRPAAVRQAEGAMPGAMVIERNVLEWRFAPSSDDRVVDLEPGQRVILFCNDGYASSIAAAELQDVDVDGATDIVGGYRAWLEHHRA